MQTCMAYDIKFIISLMESVSIVILRRALNHYIDIVANLDPWICSRFNCFVDVHIAPQVNFWPDLPETHAIIKLLNLINPTCGIHVYGTVIENDKLYAEFSIEYNINKLSGSEYYNI